MMSATPIELILELSLSDLFPDLRIFALSPSSRAFIIFAFYSLKDLFPALTGRFPETSSYEVA